MTSVLGAVGQKQAIAFDLFHTLTAIESSWGQGLPFTHQMLGLSSEAWNEQLNRHSRWRLAGEELDSFAIVARMAREIDPSLTDEAIRAAVANRMRRFEAALTDIPEETTTVLRQLRARGKKLGLISNADAMEVAAWERSPLAELFDAAVLSCRVGAVKPEPAIYRICLRQLGVSAEETAFVGDGGSSELQGARAVGMTPVMIAGIIRELWPERIAELSTHADCVIEHLSELVGQE